MPEERSTKDAYVPGINVNQNENPGIQPRPLEPGIVLKHYWLAPSGEGPLAETWGDKPHRLLYELIAYAMYLELRMLHSTPTETTSSKGENGNSLST